MIFTKPLLSQERFLIHRTPETPVALSIEFRLSDLVNQAYGLTPEEIDLMWRTAPPRMPIPPPDKRA
jgi:hypothetical protein